MTRIDIKRIQNAMLTVPGVTLPRFGADGDWGGESWAAFALVIAKAGGQAVPAAGELPGGYLDMLAKIESGGRPYVKATTSSASGLFQFIRSTWENEGGDWGDRLSLAFGGLQPSIPEQRQRATTFTLKNADLLAGAGLPINKATLYAAHFLGAGGAVRILRASTGAKIGTVTEAAQRKANPSILGENMLVQDFHLWLKRKTGDWPLTPPAS